MQVTVKHGGKEPCGRGAPKPDKRRILIKRKKEDEPTEAHFFRSNVESERQAQPAPQSPCLHRPIR